jgi:hypothetical protein
LQETVLETKSAVVPAVTENLKTVKWRLTLDILAQTPGTSADSPVRVNRKARKPTVSKQGRDSGITIQRPWFTVFRNARNQRSALSPPRHAVVAHKAAEFSALVSPVAVFN